MLLFKCSDSNVSSNNYITRTMLTVCKPAVAVTFALGEQRYVTVAGYLIHNSIEEGMRAAPYTCPCRYSNGYASLLI